MDISHLIDEEENNRECATCGNSNIQTGLYSIRLVLDERLRQINELGYDATHDAGHAWTDLAQAGACYADHISMDYGSRMDEAALSEVHPYWPFDDASWKPTRDNPVRQLVKGASLILAAIDALSRENPYIQDRPNSVKRENV